VKTDGSDGAITDAELVRRGREGDEIALGELVDRHQAAAFRVALSLVGDGDVAQDVVQDAFLKAFRGLKGFRGDATFRTWLLTITANAARGALRRQGRRREARIEAAGPVAVAAPDPQEHMAVREAAERARAMLEKLPEKQRLAVQLRIDEGLSFKEIGDVIGSSEGAARVNYFHGIHRLREWME
jgi:RNA polymerase sigma-70 factor (ECF subfamily)